MVRIATSVEVLRDLFRGNWNRANTEQRTPVVSDVTTLEPGRGKRFDLDRNDLIMIYETAHAEEAPELFYDFVNTRVNLTIDVRTRHSRDRLRQLETEVRRILHLKRKGDTTNFDRLIYKTRTDLSDKTKRLFRFTIQCEMAVFYEQIA
jgi:hypothetical protein